MKVALLITLAIVGQALAASGPGDVVGKLVVGYQGWFAAKGDDSPLGHWFHWSHDSNPPAKGNTNFEIYPDIREYPKLYDTNYQHLGNGQPARLFSPWDESTVDIHFKWMKENNIDAAALQRFAGGVKTDNNWKNQLNGIAKNVMKGAEAHDRKFYIMWDITDWSGYAGDIPDDINNNIKPLGLLNSKAYAHQNGKPVICIWGLGFTDRPHNAGAALDLVNKLKQDFYVIGGVPKAWRVNKEDSVADYQNVYLALNMVQPWTVGRYGDINGAKGHAQTWLKPDFDYCNEHNIDYQPVIYPGSAWSNLQRKPEIRNEHPRLHGDFMWAQFVSLREIGIKNCYVAMFDEYDEGTAIAKGAEDKSMIPTDEYFLTWDADGVHCSSDFYLRLVGDGNRMISGQIPLQQTHPTPHTK